MKYKKRVIFTAVLIFSVCQLLGQSRVRLACVGDSITAGVGTKNISFESYPAQLARLLGDGWEVRNFGNSGTTLLDVGDKPYQMQHSFKQALDFAPNIVVIMLGTNDTKPQNWKYKDQFVEDYNGLIEQFSLLKTQPKLYVCVPPFIANEGRWGINETDLKEQIPMILEVARNANLEVIDCHQVTDGREDLFPDDVHPNLAGATVLAKTVYAAVIGETAPEVVPCSLESEWHGFNMKEFQVANRSCRVVFPEGSLAGNPWIWRTRFFGAYAAVDVALVKRGYHLAYIDIAGMYGSPQALDLMDVFYHEMTTEYNLSRRLILEGFSRGGLSALNWAARRPERIASIYLDAPVCDFKSWPGGRGKGKAYLQDWAKCLKAYGLTEEEAMDYQENPVDHLKPLSDAAIPIIAVYGEADDVVLPGENILLIEKRYKELGGQCQLIAKPGVGHHPHSLKDPEPVLAFLLNH
jgi:lysophospholipase L1-like esterase/pimeloyl-ACP methyl ester carboxylesterase